MRERKYYFSGGNLYKVLHIFPAEGRASVMMFDSLEPVTLSVSLDGAARTFSPALKIGEVAKIFNCHPDTIRKWERAGRVEKPGTWRVGTGFGHECRFYSLQDLEDLQEAAREIHHGRPRKDKLVKNNFPDRGTIKQTIREISRRYGVNV